MAHFLNKYKYQLFLFLIVALLFWVNYSPGTYLSGWDNLQTELNPGLAVKRAFFSVWEEYQSFGLTAGMAHAADLVRAVFLWIMSFVLPQNMIRYFYHFLMLLLGGLGMFTLINPKSKIQMSNQIQNPNEIFAFFGALFYILNLGTVQIFYVPFESFSTFFAFLPWAIWGFIKVLKIDSVSDSYPPVLASNNTPRLRAVGSPSPRHLFLTFILINILGTSSFYTQQLFIVYMLVLGCTALGHIIVHPSGVQARKILFSFLLILILNSFWILPQVYFLKTNGDWVGQAKANQIATEDTLYQNLEKGTLNNFFRLEGFYFDLKGIKNTDLFAPWKDNFKGMAGPLTYVFAGLMILGLLKTIKERKYGFVLIFLLCSLALLSATPPFSWLNSIIRQNGFVNQIFRSPFTKFIIPYSLVYSYFVAKGTYIIRSDLKKYVLFLFLILIIFYSFPSFRGYLISPEMKVKIPNDYFQVMDYFKTENRNKRIALLPDYTFWGWFFNKWGYNGSGFLWYGIEQPIVSRTFDVWSPKSESYFWEQKQAFEAENLAQIEKILDKYNVDYLILDYSLIPVVSSYKSLATDRIENLFAQSQKISLVFRGENIALYQISHPQKIEDFVSLSSHLQKIGPQIKLMAEDRAYQENGDYMTDSSPDIYYPFADLTTQTRVKDKNWGIEELINSFSVNSDFGLNLNSYQFDMQTSSIASISENQDISDLKLNLNPFVENERLKINFEKLLVKSFDVGGFNDDEEFALTAPELPQKYGYLIKIRSRNIKGSTLFFYIIDDTKKQSMLEEKLRAETEYFILPHKFDYGLGYSFVFQNKSYENYPSENLLEEVSVYLFPYEELKGAKFIRNNAGLKIPEFSNDFQARKINYFTYQLAISNKQSVISNLILYQSFDPGWVAFADGKILPHILINNWANGWLLDGVTCNVERIACNIRIIFWPQYLEFLGFLLLAVCFFVILKIKEKHE